MEYEVAQKLAEEAEKLNKARADFEELKRNEGKYIAEREAKVLIKISDAIKQAEKANELLTKIVQTSAKALTNWRERESKLDIEWDKLIASASELMASQGSFRAKAEGFLDEVRRRMDQADKRTIENSKVEDRLKQETARIKAKDREADEKLEEARELVDWHNSKKGTKITIKK